MIDHDRPEPGKKYALTFTVLVHVGLLVVLFFGVQWKRSEPEVMEVELWAARSTPALQPPPPPPAHVEPKPEPRPEPRIEPRPEAPKKPDIAIREEKKKPEPKKPEPKPEPPKPEPKKPEPKPQAQKTPNFDDLLKREMNDIKPRPSDRQLANAAAAEIEQRASGSRRGAAEYANKIRVKVRGNIVLPPGIQGNPEAVFKVSQLPSGEVLDVRLEHSSGNAGLDRAIETAIRKSSPLPRPDDPGLFQRELTIKYKPFEE